jgi:AcrR family transcriptional regulator
MATTSRKTKSSSPASAGKKTESSRLDCTSWLDAAELAIAEGGFSNVRVLPLSQKLGVTRGSFYWHFENHADFVAQIIDRWKARELEEIKEWNGDVSNPMETLENIVNFVLKRATAQPRRAKIEFALRDYSGGSKVAAKAVAAIDLARLGIGYTLLKEIIGSEEETESYALLFYAQIVGAQLMTTYVSPSMMATTSAKLKQGILGSLAGLQAKHGGKKAAKSSRTTKARSGK